MYRFSKMTIIKIVLFIATLSSFGEHKGIQCIPIKFNVLNSFSSKHLETFHKRCFYALYIYIYKELYQWAEINKRRNTESEIIKQLHSSAYYYLRLLRLHDDYFNSDIINTNNKFTWNFFNGYKNWTTVYGNNSVLNEVKENYRQFIHDTANTFIKHAEEMNVWKSVDLNDENNIKYVIRDFNYCNQTLNSISSGTNFIEVQIQINMSFSFDTIKEQSEILTKYSYIMHFMKLGEKNIFVAQNDEMEKESYVIKIMKSVLNRIFYGIILLLKDIHIRPKDINTFITFLGEENKVSNRLNIIIQLYLKAIDTTKEIYGIYGVNVPLAGTRRRMNLDISTLVCQPPLLFKMFIKKFQDKFNRLCPGCFHVTYTITEYEINSFVSTADNSRDLPPIIGIYNVCWPNIWVPSENPENNLDLDVDVNIDSLEKTDKTLLEYNAYLTILYQYAIYFNGGSTTENDISFYENHKNFLENNKNKK